MNHLVLDLRDYFRDSDRYPSVKNQRSFSKWRDAIDALKDWGVLLDGIPDAFLELSRLRNRSIHFNRATYSNARQDSLRAILLLRTILEKQFGTFGLQPWYIPGTQGQLFVKKSYESNPFVKTYILPRCPFVGFLFTLKPTHSGWLCFDFEDYGTEASTDEEFAVKFNVRKIEDMANTDLVVS